MKLFEGRKRRLGDRYDGFLVRNLDPMGQVVPFIMRSKTDSWVLFEDQLDVTHTEDFLREQRKDDWKGLNLYHVLYAALVRTMSQVPQINRFVQGNRIYARNEIKIAMVVKKGMKFDGDRTIIMPRFDPDDTLRIVFDRINEEVKKIDRDVKVKEDHKKTGFDAFEVMLSLMPRFVLRFVIWLIRLLDRHGWIPKAANRLSPFHTSAFITNMGSMGMESVYHHVYELGTLSLFVALGKKNAVYETQADGSLRRRTYISIKAVVDERITDGFVYAMAFKELRMAILHPEKLLQPPKTVVEDVIDREK